ncbi:phage protein Gp13 family protein [Dongia sp.]|uniref:phage protein Gp13 family protein n=1 Tax=Dongia sp. TaxID=1977262 RepID=UPI0035B317DD
MAANLRAADRAELIAVQGYDDALGAISLSVLRSTETWVGEDESGVVCMFGVGPITLLTGTGRPWMLATDRLDRWPVALNKLVGGYLRRMLDQYPHLENWVDSRNTRHVQWLRRLGFTLHPAQPAGPFGVPFHRFEMEAT